MLSLVNALHTLSGSFHEQQYSLLLDGTGDYLDIGDNLDVTTGDFAISAWVKIEPTVTVKFPIVSKRDASDTDNGFSVYVEANQNYLRAYVQDSDGNGTEVHGAVNYTNIKDGNWHHIYIDFDRSANAVGYVDGYSDGTILDITGAEKTLTNAATLTIGKTVSAGAVANGKIDEVALFNQVLTSNAPKGIYNDGIPFDLNSPSPDGGYTQHAELRGYWRMFNGLFDDKVNTIVHDAHNPGYGAELIASDPADNRTFDNDTGNWATADASGSDVVIANVGNKLQVTTTTDNESEGASLAIAHVGDGSTTSVVAGRTYKISVDLNLTTPSSGTIPTTITFAGTSAAVFNISTTETTYTKYIVAANNTGSLFIANSTATATVFTIDNVSVRELNGYPGITAADATFSADTPDDQTMSNVLTLDGTNDYLSTQADSTLATRAYSFWCRTSITTVNGGLFGHGGVEKGGFHMNPHFTAAHNDKPIIYLGSSYYRYFEDTPAQDDGNWHHWAVYMDHTDITNCTVHVDGVALGVEHTVSSGSADAWSGPLTIGHDGGTRYFDGAIDQFAVFDTELAADAVASLAGQMWDGIDGDDANWVVYGSNTKAEDTGAVKITEAGGTQSDRGAYIYLRDISDLNADLIPGRTYKLTCEVKVSGGSLQVTVGNNMLTASSSAITSTSFVTATLYFTDVAGSSLAHLRFTGLDSTESVWIKSISLIDTNARKNDLTQTIGNYDSDWTDNLINYWKMGDGNHDEPQEGIIHDQTDSGYGAELITTPDLRGYTSVPTGWVVNNEDAPTEQITWSSNGARFYAEDSSQILHMQDSFSVTSGKTYKIEVVISNYNGSAGIKIDNTPSGGAYEMTSNGTHVFYIKAVANGVMADIYRTGSGVDLVIERFSMKELNGDPGMTTSGATIIKQPV